MRPSRCCTSSSPGRHCESGAPIVVMIATAGRPGLLRRALESISACRIPRRYRGTIVVENGPGCGAESVVNAFNDAPLKSVYLYSPIPNKSRALNRALRSLEGDELVVFTDDDVRVGENWLDAYAEASCGVPGGFVFGGPFGVDYEVEPPAWLIPFMPRSAVGRPLLEDFRPNAKGLVKYNGLNWAAFAQDLMAAGYSDEYLGPGTLTIGQEVDLQRRLWLNDIQAYTVLDAMTWHYVPVERCSPEWVLHRHYRTGLTKGFRSRLKGRGSRIRALKLGTRSSICIARAWARAVGAGTEGKRRFAACADLFYHRGVLAGVGGRNRVVPAAPRMFQLPESPRPPSSAD